jgi:hypothetical protein
MKFKNAQAHIILGNNPGLVKQSLIGNIAVFPTLSQATSLLKQLKLYSNFRKHKKLCIPFNNLSHFQQNLILQHIYRLNKRYYMKQLQMQNFYDFSSQNFLIKQKPPITTTNKPLYLNFQLHIFMDSDERVIFSVKNKDIHGKPTNYLHYVQTQMLPRKIPTILLDSNMFNKFRSGREKIIQRPAICIKYNFKQDIWEEIPFSYLVKEDTLQIVKFRLPWVNRP